MALLTEGPVAVIECTGGLPCNCCESACDRGAITVGKPITNLPALDTANCDGCALCIAACPGQAIFVVDTITSADMATLQLPYEFFPLPDSGADVDGLDREGKFICKARVVSVDHDDAFDRTAVVSIEVPNAQAMDVRNIAVGRG